MATGLVWHERYMWHNTGRMAGPFWADAAGWMEPDIRHSENVETKRRFKNLLEVSGLLDQLVLIKPRAATVEEICRFHTREYVDRIAEQSARFGGDASEADGAPFGKGSYEVALLSAGGVIEAIDAVLDGKVQNVYALNRPPGHHALADNGMGFCIFGNAAIGALHARHARGLDRVAIVDWDVHHGNGTQSAFYSDPSVLTISLHQDNNFPPDSGHVHENGEGAGEGYNLNIPLPPGTGNGGYEAAFDRVVVPALERFKPDLLIVAGGWSASAVDPLGRMMISPPGYARLTRKMMDAADALCGGRLVLDHEGGSSRTSAVLQHLRDGGALGHQDGLPGRDLHLFPEGFAGQDLQPHQEAQIAASAALLEKIR